MLADYIDEVMSLEEQFEFLDRRLIVKGFLPLSSGECYERQVSRNSHVLVQRINETGNLWTTYRITHRGERLQSVKTIAEDTDIEIVASAAERYIENYLSFIKNR